MNFENYTMHQVNAMREHLHCLKAKDFDAAEFENRRRELQQHGLPCEEKELRDFLTKYDEWFDALPQPKPRTLGEWYDKILIGEEIEFDEEKYAREEE